MPIIKSAKKKMRQDKKRSGQNKKYENAYKKQIKLIRKQKNRDEKSISTTYKLIDKAVKKGVIHKNKANRLKSSVSAIVKTKK
jgi:small subunit ribosomal protein S20